MTKREYIERREFWRVGYGAIKSQIACVHLVAGEIQKFEGTNRNAAMRDLHERLSPIYRTVRRLMRQAFTDAEVDRDPELAKLRREIDDDVMPWDRNGSEDEPATGPAHPGISAALDDGANNISGQSLLDEKKNPKAAPFSKAFTSWPVGPSRVGKRAPQRRARIL